MAPRLLGVSVLWALLFGVALLPSCFHLATAEDAEAGDSQDDKANEVASDDEDEDPDEFGDAETAGEAGSGDPVKDMKELEEKLGLLKSLLDGKGESVDPELKKKLSSLQANLGKMNRGESLTPDDMAPLEREADRLPGCVALSMMKSGVKKPATMAALQKIAAGITREEGGGVELVRMVAVCAEDISPQALANYKAGSLQELPKTMYNKAITSEGRKSVLAASDEIWKGMKVVAEAMIKNLRENGADESDPTKPATKKSTGSTMGLLVLVPIIAALCFMVKRLLDTQKENENAKKNSGKKDKKKQK